jgi:hypothetical protein
VGVLAALVLAFPFIPPAGTPAPASAAEDAAAPPAQAAPVEVRIVRERSKKEEWLADKAARPDAHVSDADLARAARAKPPVLPKRGPGLLTARLPKALPPPGTRITPLTTLFNLRTREALPILPGVPLEERLSPFLRDHYTNQSKPMDGRLVDVLSRAALQFSAPRIEVVSAYRSPKFNLMLRKKGREVARSSQHTEGQAVDFRIRGVPTKQLLHFVRALRVGGVGYYPQSQFVHSDTGPIRFWKGT